MRTMKKALILCFAVALSLPFKAALNPDSLLTIIKTQSVALGQLTVKTKADSVSKADTIKKLRAQIPMIGECRSCEINWIEKLLVVLPAALFLCLAFYFLRWLKREKFKLGDALGSDVPDSFVTNRTTTTDATNPALTKLVETTEPNYSKSSSRLIAFLTAITAIVIALSLITYYAYGYITQNSDMQNLDELWKIIAGLGIGVVPYVAKTIKGNETPVR